MATKPRRFDPNYFYHIYNCGVEKRTIFLDEKDYQRFLETLSYYLYDQKLSYAQFKNLPLEGQRLYSLSHPRTSDNRRVKLLVYCLMPNHFHLLLKPVKKNGVTVFVADLTNSYTKYFNIKNQRLGNLLQGTFKAKEIDTEESLLQVSRYIHLNPIFSSKTNPQGKLRSPSAYPFSSYDEWVLDRRMGLVDQEELTAWLKVFGGRESYRDFVEAKIDTSSPPTLLPSVKNLILEEPYS